MYKHYKRYNYKDIFNLQKVDNDEYKRYLNEGYLKDNEFTIEQKIFLVIFILFIIYGLISLTLFFLLRDSYIIRQRGFKLTFIGGILAFINVIIGLWPQFAKISCGVTVFSANFLNVAVNFIFLTRSYRVIFNYHFNIFKVSSVRKKKLRTAIGGSIEPNNYMPKINKKINKLLFLIVFIPTAIAVLFTIIIYVFNYNKFNGVEGECPLFKGEDAMIALKKNRGKELFRIVIVYGILFFILSFVNAILLYFVKDANKYGIKFECISVSIMVVIFNILNIFIQVTASDGSDVGNIIDKKDDKIENPKKEYIKGFLAFFEKTKGGKLLFTLVLIYMFFVSITLPVIHYYKAKLLNDSYIQDPSSSIQYFYKVLNTPSLVNELKNIAIKEFSVENVLFWENYQILQKMVYRYQIEYKKAKEVGNEQLVSQYDFEGYYQKIQQASFSTSSMDEYSYDPNMPVPREIMPYYTSFYHMFIDFNGPAVVNLPGNSVKHIFNEICTYPTVGIYDTAKNEVVEMMYSSIYPILLRKNQKHITTTLG